MAKNRLFCGERFGYINFFGKDRNYERVFGLCAQIPAASADKRFYRHRNCRHNHLLYNNASARHTRYAACKRPYNTVCGIFRKPLAAL